MTLQVKDYHRVLGRMALALYSPEDLERIVAGLACVRAVRSNLTGDPDHDSAVIAESLLREYGAFCAGQVQGS